MRPLTVTAAATLMIISPWSVVRAGLVGAPGDLYVAGHVSNNVLQFDGVTGEFVAAFVGDGLHVPRGIGFGPNGNLFVADSATDSIQEMDGATGQVVGPFAAHPAIDQANQLLFSPEGYLFVSNVPSSAAGSHVARMDSGTGAFLDTLGAGLLFNPQGLLLTPDGHLLVANDGAYDNVLKFDGSTGAYLGEFVSTGSGGLDDPTGMAWGPNGNLFVASIQTDRVVEFDGLSGQFIRVFASGENLQRPRVVEFGPNGNLFVANETADNVVEFDGSSGAFVRVFAESGGLDYPIGMAFKPVPEAASAGLLIVLLAWPRNRNRRL
ncbi:MAG TPA: NHL repeat-containing protein [Phycisphaerae bacterium]|nr:NHL repeat-containing protein [Phycisphaerae bacterium]